MDYLTIEQLTDLCAEWQKRLRLQHWDVAISISRKRDFLLSNAQGECNWTQSTALATIKLIDPVDYPDSPFKYDMEVVLVHELLHLHFAPFDQCKSRDDLENIMLERAIEHIARALVETKRQQH